MKKWVFLLGIVTFLFGLVGCGNQATEEQKTLKIGYFPNITHAPAMVGIEKGLFQKYIGRDIKIEERYFNHGQELLDALAVGEVDLGYVGPGPVEQRSKQGLKIKVLAEVTRGGSALVVRQGVDIKDIKDLAGKKVAVPGIGNTQDQILRKLLTDAGLKSTYEGGDVEIRAQKPATISGLFVQKQLDAALLAEPWPSMLEVKGLAKVIYQDEGVSAVMVTTPEKYQAKQALIDNFVKGHQEAVKAIKNMPPQETVQLVGRKIKEITGSELPPDILQKALKKLNFED
ncbi:NitT/TauT family transport system substrate-binding protein [Carboxydocella sporoproducens DSM 16521]|uniref:NitT/TauT family transport system substrate-binding protein n=2 Tax=Carboxydocella TaxID=178898 RepID=A0A1T4MG30_9FIRM|nr:MULTISPECIES: ABC transporter substrate-binding protein [Carboxydocella]AVX21319.1 NitT/TauT family transport system substrate-binding protein [Carboxydocella thermautotrophica]SJZ65892.1 NitT/TauT family transport system substrate-binding protein [Carboxydocella sporoproducens DSM 16521]